MILKLNNLYLPLRVNIMWHGYPVRDTFLKPHFFRLGIRIYRSGYSIQSKWEGQLLLLTFRKALMNIKSKSEMEAGS